MKLIHTSDLHLGRQFYGYNILPDQEFILNQILEIAVNENADGIIIAGDIHDTSVASGAGVDLLNRFLTKLSEKNIAAYIISGNHDSAERIHYGSSLMDKSGIYISGIYDGIRDVKVITTKDEFGKVHFCLLPYIDPSTVKNSGKFSKAITCFDDAVRLVIESISINLEDRFVLVAHQFFTGKNETPMSSESERLIVGGIESVDISCLDEFSYTALGHLHTPQKVGRETIRYAGSPLKYSPSESSRTKSVTVVELFEKGRVKIREEKLKPHRDLKTFTGSFEELMNHEPEENCFAVLQITDEIPPQNAMQNLRTVFTNIVRLEFLNELIYGEVIGARMEDLQSKTSFELFSEFFYESSGRSMTKFQERVVSDILLEISGEKR